MKPILFVAIAAGAMPLASCAPRPETTKVMMSTGATAKADGRLAGDIHAQVNAYRRTLGKPPLARHAGLDRLARDHAEFMRRNRGKFGAGIKGNLTHHGFEDRTLSAQRSLGMSDVGENIGTCRGGAKAAAGTLVDAWKRSSGHHMNLKGRWSQTGIGVVVDADGTVFATQLFGIEDRSHLTMTERMRQF